METKFKPGDKVLYNGKPFTILEYQKFVIDLSPTGHEILDEADDQFTLIDSEGKREVEVFDFQLKKIEE